MKEQIEKLIDRMQAEADKYAIRANEILKQDGRNEVPTYTWTVSLRETYRRFVKDLTDILVEQEQRMPKEETMEIIDKKPVPITEKLRADAARLKKVQKNNTERGYGDLTVDALLDCCETLANLLDQIDRANEFMKEKGLIK